MLLQLAKCIRTPLFTAVMICKHHRQPTQALPWKIGVSADMAAILHVCRCQHATAPVTALGACPAPVSACATG